MEKERINRLKIVLAEEQKSSKWLAEQTEEARALLLQMSEDYPERYEVWKRLAYLEADIQQHRENKQRDYSQMKAYYDKAMELYQKQENSDGEMLQLEAMMKELQAGKWFQSSGIEGR